MVDSIGKLSEERVLELRTKEQEMRNLEVGITNFPHFNEIVESMVVSLDTSVRHEEEETSQIIMKAEEIRKLPGMEGRRGQEDPYFDISEAYKDSVMRLLKASAFKTWMIKYLNLEVEKFLLVLTNQKNDFNKMQELIVKESLFNTFVESMERQMQMERDMFQTALYKRFEDIEQKINEIVDKLDIVPLRVIQTKMEEKPKKEKIKETEKTKVMIEPTDEDFLEA